MKTVSTHKQFNTILYRRISLVLILSIVLVFAIGVYYQVHKRETLIKTELSFIKNNYTEISLDFQRKTQSISNFAASLYEINKQANQSINYDSISQHFLNDELSQLQYAKGIGFWYEPFAFDKDKKYYGLYSYSESDSIIFTLDYNREDYDYFSWIWYQTCLPSTWDRKIPRPSLAYWSKPFFDTGATRTLMITVSSPVYSHSSEIVGISTIDLALDSLINYSKSVKLSENSESFIIHLPERQLLSYSPDSSKLLAKIDDIEWLTAYDFMPRNDEIKTTKVSINRLGYRLYTFTVGNSILYGFLVPSYDFYLPLVLALIITCFVGGLIIGIIIYLVRNTFKEVNNLNTQNKELNEYLSKIMNTVPDVILVQNQNGDFLEANDTFEKVFGYSKSDINNYTVDSISGEQIKHEDVIEKTNFALEKGVADFEWVCKRANGEEFPALVRLRKLDITNLQLVLVVLLDITDIKKRENEIKELNTNLEIKVIERTRQLEDANIELESEIQTRKETEEDLLKTNEELTVLNETIADDTKRLLKLNDDITISEQKLRDANNAKDKFIGILAHDIKNPLHAIIISSDFLLHEHDKIDKKEVENVLSTINKSVKHVSTLLDNLLLWSRSQSGRMEINPQLIDLQTLILECVEFFKHLADKKNINIEINIPHPIKLSADRNMLETIIRNLLSNAIKFSNNGSTVTINAANGKYLDYVQISVEDTGLGIAKEHHHKLFNTDVSYTTKGTNQEQGTGLGLLLCKEFVDKHDGKIWVESEIDKGSKFFFTIPKI